MDKQLDHPDFNLILDELLNDKRIKEKDAKEKIKQLQGLMPAPQNLYKPSGKINSKRLPVFIIGMLIIGALFIPMFNFYIGFIHGAVASSSPQLRGVDYGTFAGRTFYLIGGLLIIHIIVSVLGTNLLGKLALCRNTKVALAASFLPSAVIIFYLQTTASSYFSNEGYLTFVSLLSILVFISSLVVLLCVGDGYAASHMYDENHGKYLEKWKSPKLNIWMANDFLRAVQGRKEEDLLKIVETASLNSGESKIRQSGANYFQLYIIKVPSGHEYQHGYIEGKVAIVVTARGNKNITGNWPFIFERMEKPLIEKLDASLKKLA